MEDTIKTKIQYMTSKGQITLPAAWRKRVATNAVIVRQRSGNSIEISPVAFDDDGEEAWVTVFDKDRDNNGKGLTAEEFLRALGRPLKKNVRRKVKRQR